MHNSFDDIWGLHKNMNDLFALIISWKVKINWKGNLYLSLYIFIGHKIHIVIVSHLWSTEMKYLLKPKDVPIRNGTSVLLSSDYSDQWSEDDRIK